MQGFVFGNVQFFRVVEWQGAFSTIDVLFPSMPDERWRRNASWLAPEFIDDETRDWQANVQTWVLRSEGRTILIDTGIGNDKTRAVDVFNKRNGDFLDRLETAGVRPEDVDVVINTHIHNDHVGWNTRLVDGDSVPTFPNAQYLISRADFDYWNPVNGHIPASPFQSAADTGITFEDSILPVHQAGQAVLWEGNEYRIDEHLVLESTPGHTPGSAVLRLDSGTDRALFVGDVIHTPLQVLEPDHDTCLSEDQAEASRSRRRVLSQAAATNSLVIPAHLRGTGIMEVAGSHGNFSIKDWGPRTGA
ncbi:MBL fold metallo-hydrolase [Actinoplanes rectilineatus]|uniref:MBL fold metallo-hydrolase n=1 Tax=Actinoplanes rectilineatus TaxID=113571 RepID=UPI0005F2E5CA|nr:MBL fold metallo-hydrolase [Actinoplanes rectilineatus]